MDNKVVGRKIRLVRLSRSLSQENIANDLGLSLTGYANIENGKTNIPFQRLSQIADYLNVSLVELLEWNEKQNKQGADVNKQLEDAKKELEYLKQLVKTKDKLIKALESKKK